jgi:death-on-curing protein
MNGAVPLLLTVEQAHLLHDRAIREHGGSHGVRDPGLVESAVASARNAFLHGGGDLFDVAAAYAYHLAESQAFLDGNKRTAVAAALTFLDMNAECRRPDPDELQAAMIALANKRLDKPGLAAKFRALAAWPASAQPGPSS